MSSEDLEQYSDEDDPILARLIPRKANRWIYATIAAEFVKNVLHSAETAMEDLTTVFSQRFNYEEDRQKWSEGVGYEIERVDDFLKEMEEADACAD